MAKVIKKEANRSGKTVIYYRKGRGHPLESPHVKWVAIRVTKELSFVWGVFTCPFQKDVPSSPNDYFILSREQAEILFEFEPSDKIASGSC